jgi:hypothetical protein
MNLGQNLTTPTLGLRDGFDTRLPQFNQTEFKRYEKTVQEHQHQSASDQYQCTHAVSK